MKVFFTAESSNRKTGNIPVTLSSMKTCPKTCPFIGAGCYADIGPLAIWWTKVTNNDAGLTWNEFCEKIAELPEGTLWRHNQAGDLPGVSTTIDRTALQQLVRANLGKRGFTYTHKPLTVKNSSAIRSANRRGFTVNLSANNLAHADTLYDSGVGPVTVVLPMEKTTNTQTPQGRKVVVCPATQRDDVTCKTCKLCAIADRDFIIGFPAHGVRRKKASEVARG